MWQQLFRWLEVVTSKNECPRSVGTKLVDLGCVFLLKLSWAMGELLMSETPGLGGLGAESYSMESSQKRLQTFEVQ